MSVRSRHSRLGCGIDALQEDEGPLIKASKPLNKRIFVGRDAPLFAGNRGVAGNRISPMLIESEQNGDTIHDLSSELRLLLVLNLLRRVFFIACEKEK